MRQVMVGDTMPAQQQIVASINEDDEYFAYRKKLDEAIEKLVNKGKK
jgi:hypothetical protein